MSGEADTVNFLDLPDDEIMKMTSPPVVTTELGEPEAGAGETVEAGAADQADQVTQPEAPAAGETTTAPAGEGAAAEGETGADVAAAPAGDTTSKGEPEAGVTEPAKTEPEPPKPIDFEAEYKRILAPFKANGKDIQVSSVDDAINLMQMGANYNKKMAALKPSMKVLKLLENNGLLDEGKLSFLIDLDKKNPGAIQKLVKESGIDPMEFDAEKAGAYKPTARTVDDREIELDTVLDEISGSAAYGRTLEVVSTKWDAASKQAVSQAPQLLKVINSHMASGVYDVVSTEVERERVFGRLQGLSDLEAYKQVGDAIQARGGFNHLFEDKTSTTVATSQPPAAPVIVQPKPKADETALNDKRRAASPTQTAVTTAAPSAEFNPLALPDDEFAKLAAPKYR